jgi:hypothetical protein
LADALHLLSSLSFIETCGVEGDSGHLGWLTCPIRPSPARQGFGGGHQGLKAWKRDLRQPINGLLAGPMHEQKGRRLGAPQQGQGGR